MANRYSAWIEIGGQCTPEVVGELFAAAETYCAGLSWGETSVGEAADWLAVREIGDPLAFYDEEHSGQFQRVRDVCARHGLTYVYREEDDGEGGPNAYWFTPERGEGGCPLWGDQPAVTVEEVSGALAKCTTNAGHVLGPQLVEAVNELIALNTPPEVPPLVVAEQPATA